MIRYLMDLVKKDPLDYPFSKPEGHPRRRHARSTALLAGTDVISLQPEDIGSDVARSGIPELGRTSSAGCSANRARRTSPARQDLRTVARHGRLELELPGSADRPEEGIRTDRLQRPDRLPRRHHDRLDRLRHAADDGASKSWSSSARAKPPANPGQMGPPTPT
ncbi:MAG: hypothetical protein MZU97_09565 [Bacillus subtilis]|nr:hypothetical protein [Bacillus subtilis]